MSYARWSTSNWYAFDNVNGRFSLWHIEHGPHPDLIYEDLRDHRDAGTLTKMLRSIYPGVNAEDVAEAIEIIGWVLEEAV
jgi:hypothetical protein